MVYGVGGEDKSDSSSRINEELSLRDTDPPRAQRGEVRVSDRADPDHAFPAQFAPS